MFNYFLVASLLQLQVVRICKSFAFANLLHLQTLCNCKSFAIANNSQLQTIRYCKSFAIANLLQLQVFRNCKSFAVANHLRKRFQRRFVYSAAVSPAKVILTYCSDFSVRCLISFRLSLLYCSVMDDKYAASYRCDWCNKVYVVPSLARLCEDRHLGESE